jgi:hypothetical protein
MWRSNWSGSTRTRQVPPSQTWSVTDGCLDSYLNLNTTISGCHPTLTCFHTNTRRLWHLTLPPPPTFIHHIHSITGWVHHRSEKATTFDLFSNMYFMLVTLQTLIFLCVPCQQHRLMMISCSFYAQRASPFPRLSSTIDRQTLHRPVPRCSFPETLTDAKARPGH